MSQDTKELKSLQEFLKLLEESGDISPKRFENQVEGEVKDFKVTRDNKYMFMASKTGLFKWNIDRHEVIKNVYPKPSLYVALNHEESQICIGTQDRELVFLDLKSDEKKDPAVVKNAHKQQITMLLSSGIVEDSVASCSIDGFIHIWSFDARGLLRSIDTKNELCCLAFSPKKKYIISTGAKNHIGVWDFSTGKKITLLNDANRGNSRSEIDIVSSKNSGGSGGKNKASKHASKVDYYSSLIMSIVAIDDLNLIIAGSFGGNITFWDVNSRKEIHTIVNAHNQASLKNKGFNSIDLLFVFKNDRYLLSGTRDFFFKIWDLHKKTVTVEFQHYYGDFNVNPIKLLHIKATHKFERPIIGAHFNKDNNKLYVGSNKTIRVWDFSNQKFDGKLQKGHSREVTCIAATNDGRYTYSVSNDLSIIKWDTQTRKVITNIAYAHGDPITQVILAESLNLMVTGDFKGNVKFWNLKEGKLLEEVEKAHAAEISCLAVSKTQKLMASGSQDGSLGLWSLRKRELLAITRPHDHRVNHIIFTNMNRGFISASKDDINLWTLLPVRRRDIIKDRSKGAVCLTLSMSDQRLYTGGSNILKAWDYVTRELIFEINLKQEINKLHLINNDHFLIIVGEKLSIFDIANRYIIYSINSVIKSQVAFLTRDHKSLLFASEKEIYSMALGHKEQVESITMSLIEPNHSNVIEIEVVETQDVFIIAFEQYIILRDFTTGEFIQKLVFDANNDYDDKITPYTITCVCCNPNETLLFVGTDSNMIHIYNLEQQKYESKGITCKSDSGIQKINATAKIIACIVDGQKMVVFDIESREKLHNLNCPEKISSFALSKNSRYMVTAAGNLVDAWDFRKRKMIETMEQEIDSKKTPIQVGLLRNSKYFITAAESINVYDFAEKELLISLPPIKEDLYITRMVISEDESQLVSGYVDGSIAIWDIGLRKMVKHFENAHSKAINDLALCKSNDRLISSSIDNTVKVWDLDLCKNVYDLPARSLVTIAFETTKDGKMLFRADYEMVEMVDLIKLQKEKIKIFSQNSSKPFLKLTDDDKYLIISTKNQVDVWDIKERTISHSFKVDDESKLASLGAYLTRDLDFLIGLTTTGKLRIWDFESKDQIYTCHFTSEVANDLPLFCYSNQDKILYCGVSDRLELVYLGKLSKNYPENPQKKKSLQKIGSLNPPSRTSSQENRWEMALREPLMHLAISHDESMLCLAFKDRVSIYNRAIMEKTRWFEFSKSTKYLSYRGGDDSDSSSSSDSSSESGDDREAAENSSDDSDSDSEMKPHKRRESRRRAKANKLKCIAFTRDDNFLLLGFNNLRVEVWDILICHHVHTFCLWRFQKFDSWNLPSIASITVSQDNRQFIIGTTDGRATSLSNIFENQRGKAITAHPYKLSPYTIVSNLLVQKMLKVQDAVEKSQMINYYSDLKVYNYQWNIFHLVCKFQPRKMSLNYVLKNYIPHVVDSYNRTPIQYLLEQENFDPQLFYLICDNFGKVIPKFNSSHYESLKTIVPLIPQIVSFDTPQVINFMKEGLIIKPSRFYSGIVPTFGTLSSKKKERVYALGSSPSLTPSIQNQLLETTSGEKIALRCLGINLNFHLGSDDCYKIMKAFDNVDSEEMFRAKSVSVLIDFLWKKSSYFHNRLAFLFSVYMIIMSIYGLLKEPNVAIEVLLFIFGLGFLMYEIIQSWASGYSVYTKDIWNGIDLIENLLVCISMIVFWSVDIDDLSRNWLISLILMLGYGKWISFFRVFESSRTLIRIMIDMFRDIKYFLLIMGMIIMGFSLIFYQFFDDTSYGDELIFVYNILYGDFDISRHSPSGKIFFAIVSFILSVILLNFIIAIMTDSYEKVQEKNTLADTKEKVSLILEAIVMRKSFDSCCVKRRMKNWQKKEMKYMIPSDPNHQHKPSKCCKRFKKKGSKKNTQKESHHPSLPEWVHESSQTLQTLVNQETKSPRDPINHLSLSPKDGTQKDSTHLPILGNDLQSNYIQLTDRDKDAANNTHSHHHHHHHRKSMQTTLGKQYLFYCETISDGEENEEKINKNWEGRIHTIKRHFNQQFQPIAQEIQTLKSEVPATFSHLKKSFQDFRSHMKTELGRLENDLRREFKENIRESQVDFRKQQQSMNFKIDSIAKDIKKVVQISKKIDQKAGSGFNPSPILTAQKSSNPLNKFTLEAEPLAAPDLKRSTTINRSLQSKDSVIHFEDLEDEESYDYEDLVLNPKKQQSSEFYKQHMQKKNNSDKGQTKINLNPSDKK